MKRYNKEQVLEASIEYFNGDKLAANAFLKYALRKVNDKGEDIFYELTPEDMHRRMAWEFARIENKYPSESKLTEEEIFELFDGFKKHCPQGSPMMGIGLLWMLQKITCRILLRQVKEQQTFTSVEQESGFVFRI